METNSLVDLFLLNKFQKISDKVQDYFGYNNFDIAKLCNIIMLILWIPRLIFNILAGLKGLDYFVLPMALIFVYLIKDLIKKTEIEVKNNPTFANPCVLKYSFLRLIMRFIAIMAVIFLIDSLYNLKFTAITNIEHYKYLKEIFFNLFDIATFLSIYFISCTPKPYKTSKIRNLLNKFKKLINSIFEKSSIPEPAYVRV